MWDLPGTGLKPVSPALAGRFLSPAPPGKPYVALLKLPQAQHRRESQHVWGGTRQFGPGTGGHVGLEHGWSGNHDCNSFYFILFFEKDSRLFFFLSLY